MEKLDISILYVEDEDYIRQNMVTSLRRRVETIYSAANGAEGLEQFIENHPDLVITDIRMPIMSGLEMIKKIRKIKDNTKIIMLSAHSDTNSLMEAIEIGVNGYVLKPFKIKRLFKLIEDLAKSIILDKKVHEQSKKINELYNSLVKDLETAGSVQEYLLPDYLIVEPEIFFTSTYVPSSKIGGDLFDIISLSDNEYISYIGDISGHGVKAALLMTAVKTTINRIIEDEKLQEPHQIMNRLSAILTRELFSSDYMTLIICYINCQKKFIKTLNAGHPPLMIYDKQKQTVQSYKSQGSIPIGWVPNYLYTPDEENELSLNQDQIFFLYTDGLFECENTKGEELGIEGLKNFIKNSAKNQPAAVLPLNIRDSLLENGYDISSDDFTLLAFSLLPDKETKDYLTFFSGNIITDLNLIVDNSAKIASMEMDNIEITKDLRDYCCEWLGNLIDTENSNSEKENRFLAKIETSGKNQLKVIIWAKTMKLKNTDSLEEAGRISDVLKGKLKIELSGKSHHGFDELMLIIKADI